MPPCLGGILIILAAPLFIGYLLGDKENQLWLRLGLLMGGVGIVLLLLSLIMK